MIDRLIDIDTYLMNECMFVHIGIGIPLCFGYLPLVVSDKQHGHFTQ